MTNGVYVWSGSEKLVKSSFSAASHSGTVVPSLMEVLLVRTYAFERSDDARVCINRAGGNWLIGLPPEDVFYGAASDDAAAPPTTGWRTQSHGVAPPPNVWLAGKQAPDPSDDASGACWDRG